eukprot:m.453805 g.453805  ORF g.453805 m.453805 type:complete len:486 (-) comp21556_c0_seq3:110-1567(-)
MDRCFLLVVGLSSCCATAAIRNPFMDMTSEDLTSFGQVVERLTRKSITMSEARCGPIDVAASRGSGAAYYWCTDVIKGTPNPLGLSYGIERWDTWSKYLATDYKVKTHLFDCFMPDVVIPQYPTPHEKFPTCLANRSYVDASGRRFEPIGNDLADRDPLSTFVKIDIEGMEWTVLEALTQDEISKIALLDLEIHWCLQQQQDSPATILKVLRNLLKDFLVVGSMAELDWMHGTGCSRSPVQTSMMSVSYVNRHAMFGQIIKDATASYFNLPSPGQCQGYNKDAKTQTGAALTICSKLYKSSYRVKQGLSFVVQNPLADDAGTLRVVLETEFSVGMEDFACKIGSDGRVTCSSGDASAVPAGVLLKEQLDAAKVNQYVVQLDIQGHEFIILDSLTDEQLDKIAELHITFNFCDATGGYEGYPLVVKVMRRLQYWGLITGRDIKFGSPRDRCGCLVGQTQVGTASYVNRIAYTGRRGTPMQSPDLLL